MVVEAGGDVEEEEGAEAFGEALFRDLGTFDPRTAHGRMALTTFSGKHPGLAATHPGQSERPLVGSELVILASSSSSRVTATRSAIGRPFSQAVTLGITTPVILGDGDWRDA